MGYPIHENAFRSSLKRYILHRRICIEQVFEMTGYQLFLNVQGSTDPYVPFREKVRFEMCQSALLYPLYCEEEKIYCL